MLNFSFKKVSMFLPVVCLFFSVCLVSCNAPDYVQKFREELVAGNLSEAQGYLVKIENKLECQNCALQLIKAYVKADAMDRAVLVYEQITPWHLDRYDMDWRGGYSKEACKLLRTGLVKQGDYETALNYFPLNSSNENYIENAKSYYMYLTEVVADMCVKGKQEEARKFVEFNLRWFVVNVDSDTRTYDWAIEIKKVFNSNAVRDKLFQQIDNSY